MVFSRIEYLIKMTNIIYSNLTWFATFCIYLLPKFTHLFTQLITYLPIIHPPTIYQLLTQLYTHTFSPTYLSTYLPTYLYFFIFIQPTYLNTHLPIYYLPTHSFIYLSLIVKCNHQIYPNISQILTIMFMGGYKVNWLTFSFTLQFFEEWFAFTCY